MFPHRTPARTLLAAAVALPLLAGCVAGEETTTASGGTAAPAGDAGNLSIDFATYNPLSLVIRDQGWLEDALAEEGVEVQWVQSAGSNRANEALRAGAIDVGSTAGSAALLARANGSPIRTIDVYSQPEWSALVVPADSDITSVADLAGRSVAATRGTDPYFFLLQSLEEAGVDPRDVTIENLQHADGRTALENGAVQAWAGLDPVMAASEAEAGTELLYRNVDFNTYGFLNAREDFLQDSPDVAQTVVNAYEHARAWAQQNPEELAEILAEVAGIELEVARTTILERTTLDLDPVPGDAQRAVLERVGPILVDSGDVPSQGDVDSALDELFDPTFAQQADPAAVGTR